MPMRRDEALGGAGAVGGGGPRSVSWRRDDAHRDRATFNSDQHCSFSANPRRCRSRWWRGGQDVRPPCLPPSEVLGELNDPKSGKSPAITYAHKAKQGRQRLEKSTALWAVNQSLAKLRERDRINSHTLRDNCEQRPGLKTQPPHDNARKRQWYGCVLPYRVTPNRRSDPRERASAGTRADRSSLRPLLVRCLPG